MYVYDILPYLTTTLPKYYTQNRTHHRLYDVFFTLNYVTVIPGEVRYSGFQLKNRVMLRGNFVTFYFKRIL